jgi:hypothetical protein
LPWPHRMWTRHDKFHASPMVSTPMGTDREHEGGGVKAQGARQKTRID